MNTTDELSSGSTRRPLAKINNQGPYVQLVSIGKWSFTLEIRHTIEDQRVRESQNAERVGLEPLRIRSHIVIPVTTD